MVYVHHICESFTFMFVFYICGFSASFMNIFVNHLCVWVYKRVACVIYFNNKPIYRDDSGNWNPCTRSDA